MMEVSKFKPGEPVEAPLTPPQSSPIKKKTRKSAREVGGKRRKLYSSNSKDDADDKSNKDIQHGKSVKKSVEIEVIDLDTSSNDTVIYPLAPLETKLNELKQDWVKEDPKAETPEAQNESSEDEEDPAVYQIRIVDIRTLMEESESEPEPELEWTWSSKPSPAPSRSPASLPRINLQDYLRRKSLDTPQPSRHLEVPPTAPPASRPLRLIAEKDKVVHAGDPRTRRNLNLVNTREIPTGLSHVTSSQGQSNAPKSKQVCRPPFPSACPSPPLCTQEVLSFEDVLSCGEVILAQKLLGYSDKITQTCKDAYRIDKIAYVENLSVKCDGRCLYYLFNFNTLSGIIRNIQFGKVVSQSTGNVSVHAVVTFASPCGADSAISLAKGGKLFHCKRSLSVTKYSPKNVKAGTKAALPRLPDTPYVPQRQPESLRSLSPKRQPVPPRSNSPKRQPVPPRSHSPKRQPVPPRPHPPKRQPAPPRPPQPMWNSAQPGPFPNFPQHPRLISSWCHPQQGQWHSNPMYPPHIYPSPQYFPPWRQDSFQTFYGSGFETYYNNGGYP